MQENIEQETELGIFQPSQMVTGVSRPSLPSARITLPVQEVDKEGPWMHITILYTRSYSYKQIVL